MKNSCLLIALLAFTTAIAQTKLISHKIHSGSMATFSTALENNLFDMGDSNFGQAPERTVRTAKLDSVIFISPEKAIMVTSEYCQTKYTYKSEKENANEPKALWKAGRDTVYNHVLFSRNHSLDSIKEVLKMQYSFRNDTDNTVFVGYDNKVRKYKREKRNSIPVVPNNNTGFPDKPMLVFALTLLSVLIMLISYYFYKTRQTLTA